MEPARHRIVIADPVAPAGVEMLREARDRAAVEAARMTLEALRGSLEVSALNLPFSWDGSLDPGYLLLAEQLGKLAASLGDSVGYVNVERIGRSRGLELVRRAHSGGTDYPSLLGLTVGDGATEITLAGTLFDDRRPRMVRFGRIPVEFTPEGRLLVLRTLDRPGVVGRVGTLLGEAGVNITDIHLARRDGEEDAWAVLRLDEVPGSEILDHLIASPELRTARLVDLGHPWPGPTIPRVRPKAAPPSRIAPAIHLERRPNHTTIGGTPHE